MAPITAARKAAPARPVEQQAQSAPPRATATATTAPQKPAAVDQKSGASY